MDTKPGAQTKHLQRILSWLNPWWLYLSFRGGRCILAGRYEVAKRLFDKSLSSNPFSGSDYGHRGYARVQLGDVHGGIADYSEAIRIDPHVLNHFLNRSAARISTGDFAGSLADATVVVEKAQDPLFASAGLLNRGNALMKLGHYDQAIADYTAAIVANPPMVTAFSNRGSAHLAKEEYELAIADTTEALLRDPRYTNAYLNRSLARSKRKDYDGARADASEAIRLDPDFVRAYACRGLIHQEQGNHSAAIDDFSEAIRLDPSCTAALTNRGNSFRAIGEQGRAIADFDQVVKIMKGDAPVAILNRGIARKNAGDIALAIADYTEVIRLDPGRNDTSPTTVSKAYFNRGIAYQTSHDFKRAIVDYEDAIRVDPANTLALNNIAWVLATCPEPELRDGPRAVEIATCACEQTQWKQGGLVDTLAAAHAEVGNFAEASRLERLFIEFDLTKERRDAGLEKLASYERQLPYRMQ